MLIRCQAWPCVSPVPTLQKTHCPLTGAVSPTNGRTPFHLRCDRMRNSQSLIRTSSQILFMLHHLFMTFSNWLNDMAHSRILTLKTSSECVLGTFIMSIIRETLNIEFWNYLKIGEDGMLTFGVRGETTFGLRKKLTLMSPFLTLIEAL